MKRRLGGVLLLTAIVAWTGSVANASQEAFLQQRQLIELKSAHLKALETRSAFERKQQLFEQGLIARAELDQSRNVWQQAQLDFQQVFLSLFSQVPTLAITGAVKSRTAAGRIQVELTVENRSGAALDYRQLGIDEAETPLPDQLQMRELRQIVGFFWPPWRELSPWGSA